MTTTTTEEEATVWPEPGPWGLLELDFLRATADPIVFDVFEQGGNEAIPDLDRDGHADLLAALEAEYGPLPDHILTAVLRRDNGATDARHAYGDYRFAQGLYMGSRLQWAFSEPISDVEIGPAEATSAIQAVSARLAVEIEAKASS